MICREPLFLQQFPNLGQSKHYRTAASTTTTVLMSQIMIGILVIFSHDRSAYTCKLCGGRSDRGRPRSSHGRHSYIGPSSLLIRIDRLPPGRIFTCVEVNAIMPRRQICENKNFKISPVSFRRRPGSPGTRRPDGGGCGERRLYKVVPCGSGRTRSEVVALALSDRHLGCRQFYTTLKDQQTCSKSKWDDFFGN